jgi:alpha-L-fucosidase 2
MLKRSWVNKIFAARTPVALAFCIGIPMAGQTLWYSHPPPATKTTGASSVVMEQGLPIGNGRVGGMVMGNLAHDHFHFNDITLWTGDERIKGGYQAFGDLITDLPGHDKGTNYRRALDIGDATATVTYELNGVAYKREYLASYPAGVLVIRMTADKPGSYTGQVSILDAHGALPQAADTLIVDAGKLDNGLKYEARLAVHAEGGAEQTVRDSEGKAAIAFSRCDSITLVLGAGTDYLESESKHWRGPDPHDVVVRQVESALHRPYVELRAEHVADYQRLYNRVKIDLGAASKKQAEMPTDERIQAVVAQDDPDLESLLFQYGRYNLIESSRDSLPANLQGLWNDSNNQAWQSDYHANINLEMNYWGAEPANLSEMAVPLIHFIDAERVVWQRATAAEPQFKMPGGDVRGWAIRTENNIYGQTNWKWDRTANAWYCQHLWDHYSFGGDKTYLKQTAYPIMKEVVEFWEDHLKSLPDGRLVVPNGWSPEHGPVQDGVSYNQEIVWDLFDNFVHAGDVLGVDKSYRDKVASMRDKLVVPGIGRWGQLEEWMISPDDGHTELDTPNDHHRHTSHLFGVYPGHQFSPSLTPKLAAAAKVSLAARGDTGDSRRQWVWAWRTALWARLGDGEMAHQMIVNLFHYNQLPNMIGVHPPQQWDSVFGITGTMSEMFLQSQTGELNLLPALPKAWPDGSISGLRARGGYTVSMVWKKGHLTSLEVTSTWGTGGHIRYQGRELDLHLKPGQTLHLNGNLKTMSTSPNS